MKKKIFSYLLIGAMALSLIACSKKEESLVAVNPVEMEQTVEESASDKLEEKNNLPVVEEQKETENDTENVKQEVESEETKEAENTEVIKGTQKKEESSKSESVTKVVSNTIERPSAANTSTTKSSTTKPSTKKPSTKKPSTKKPSTTKPSTKKPSTSKPSTTKPNTTKPVQKVTLSSIHKAVKKAYGENYIPSMSFDKTMLEEVYGIKPAWYTDIIGEGPMMSTHVDTFIAVQANKKNVNDVVKALEKYRDGLINDSLQYPMNLPKINASQILKVDNNVFFIMLGVIPEDTKETEEALLKAAKEQNQIAVNAIKKAMKK